MEPQFSDTYMAITLLWNEVCVDIVDVMTTRIDLTIDKQGRMSVGKLGLREGHAVAEPLPDDSGWIIRAANLYTEAEIDILSAGSGAELVEQGLDDLEHGRTSPAYRR